MSLLPLLNEPLVVQLHAFAAIAAFVFGVVQIVAPKGTLPHRALGWVWVILLSRSVVVLDSWPSWRLWRNWSPIHLLSIFTPIMLVWASFGAPAQRPRSQHHDDFDLPGALVIAGMFTFVPGRIMHHGVVRP